MLHLKHGSMIAGVLLVVSIATMAGRGTEPARADAQALPSITIPVIYSATGPAGGFGKLARVGFDLAVSQVNAQGGIRGRRLKLRYTDDGTDPIRAVRLTDDAVNTKAPVVIGPILSASATAALPRCVQAKVACIATITGNAPAIRDAAPWGFSFIQPGDLIAKKGTNLFLKARKPQRFGQIIDKVNPSMVLQAQGFVQAATTARITLLDPQYTSETGVDFSAQVTSLKAQRPDAVYIAVLNSASPGLVQEIRRQGITVPIFASTAAISGNFIQAAGAAGNGVYGYAELWSADPKISRWVTSVKARGGIADTVDSAAFDTIKMLAKVLNYTGLGGNQAALRKRVQQRIHNIQFRGVQSTYDWDSKGIPKKTTYLLQVRNGQFAKVASG